MGVTIREIAELSGVSRGTVDRVLNRRGKVRPETEAKVKKIALELGYRPNLVGKALAIRRKRMSVGVLLQSQGNPFFDDVLSGIGEAENELRDNGIVLRVVKSRGYDVAQQLAMLDELEKNSDLIIFTPINHPEIARKIGELSQREIPVITLNTDIENSSRICYIGSDYESGGRCAGGMMGLLTAGRCRVGLVTGSRNILGHNQRLSGFRQAAGEHYPEMKLIGLIETEDDDVLAYERTKEFLERNPEINALFLAAAGSYGVCRAVLALGREKDMTIVGFDKIPSTQEMMERGLIKAVICQQPFEQGRLAVRTAFRFLLLGELEGGERRIVENQIRILENL